MPKLKIGDGTCRYPYKYFYHGSYITTEQAALRAHLHKNTICHRLKKTGDDMEADLDKWVDGRCRKEE